jgi:hypothetical protein
LKLVGTLQDFSGAYNEVYIFFLAEIHYSPAKEVRIFSLKFRNE